jgi:hypothetical protein
MTAPTQLLFYNTYSEAASLRMVEICMSLI